MKIGFSEVDITPQTPVEIASCRLERGGKGVVLSGIKERLYCTVFYFEENSHRGCIVSLDLLWISRNFSDAVKEWADKELELTPSQLLLTGTHTHSSPQLLQNAPFYGAMNSLYVSFLKEKVCIAIKNAYNNKRGSVIKSGSFIHRLPVVNRNLVRFSFRRWRRVFVRAPNFEKYVDKNLRLAVIYSDNYDVLGMIVSFAVHPVFYKLNLISSDYPGLIRKKIKERYGKDIKVVFLQGFCGDVRPAFVTDSLENRVRTTLRYGKPYIRFKDKIESEIDEFCDMAVKSIHDYESNVLRKKASAPTKNEYQAKICTLSPFNKKNSKARDNNESDILVQLLDIPSGITLLAVNAEIFSEYAMKIERIGLEFDKIVWPVGYANGMFGYLPDEAMLALGSGYEYNSWRNFSHDGPVAKSFPQKFTGVVSKLLKS